MEKMNRVADLLRQIYGRPKGQEAFDRVRILMTSYSERWALQGAGDPDEKEVILITYGDSIRRNGEAPLKTLRTFIRAYLKDAVSTVHFLPFFPYSSDDGFSVIDYLKINPVLGTWRDVHAFSPDFRLMFDWVINHISAQSPWFGAYLASEPGFRNLAIEVDPDEDLSRVTRPRSLPLLTPVEKRDGRTVYVWTTFSDDQVDLNFRSIEVLIAMTRVLLEYVQHGASILRLDAIAYLWKKIGTPCIHLPETHLMVKLFRSILDCLAPHVWLITETNVPHAENISYFGDRGDEAQMVYNFSLPPLLLHAFFQEDVSLLSRWAETLGPTEEHTTFFNFTASHDGIGVRPLEGLVPSEDIAAIIKAVKANGGDVSYKRNPDGSDSPYELNITYVDALRGSGSGGDEMHARRFLVTQSIALVLPGVPGIYIHSLLGSRNWSEGVALTGRARTINREKLDVDGLVPEIENPETFRSRVFAVYTAMILVRRAQPAFHPKAEFKVLPVAREVFAIVRSSQEQTVIALSNVTSRYVAVDIAEATTGPTRDLLSKRLFTSGKVTMAPYEVLWLIPA